MNVVLKGGTNEFHGVAHWTLQNDKLFANSWLNNKNGDPRPAYKQNLYGANIGGPIIKDKMFFFVNYQAIKIRHGARTSQLTIS